MGELKRKVGRPKGSLKKEKSSSNYITINLNKHIENTPIINDETPYQWVNWGKMNNFPVILMDLYANSVTHSACVDFLVNAIMGEGVDYEKMKLNSEEVVPNPYESWDNLLRKISLDLVLFGGFAIQIIKNRDDLTYSFFHTPFSTLRFGKKDENGEIKKCYLCKDWYNWAKFPPVEVNHLNSTDDISLKKGVPYILTYVNYNIFDEYYPTANYMSALDAITTDIKLKNYDLNAVTNNFSPSGALVLNQVEDEQEKALILKNVTDMFSGNENANNLLVTFKNGNDDAPIQFVPFTANVENVNIFNDSNMRTINRIVSAHKIASKTLIGINLDNNGFASEADVIENAFNLTEKLTTKNLRTQLIKTINTLFKLNGIEQEVNLKPLSLNLADTNAPSVDNSANEVEKIENPENEDTQIA